MIQGDIDAFKIAEQAVKAAEEASDGVQALVDGAKELVEKLSQDTEAETTKKLELEDRLNTIQQRLDSEGFSTATLAVEAAQNAVNKVKGMLEKGIEGEELLKAVEEAEQKLSEAQMLVGELTNSEKKAILQDELDNILYRYVEEYVILAEKLITQQSINKANELLNRLPNEKRGRLPERLAVVQVLVNIINDAIILVNELEKNPNRDGLAVARLAVTEVNKINGKASLAGILESRLDNVEKKLLKTNLESLISQAEAAIVGTSDKNGNDILVGNDWVDAGTQTTFTTAIATANNVLNNENVTLEQFKTAIAALGTAITNYNGNKGKGSYTVLNAAIAAVEKAEKIDDQTANVEAKALYDAAKDLVEQLGNEPERPGLENRLVAVDIIINAILAVEKAEAVITLTNIKAAEDLVKLIQQKNNVIKMALENRLEKLKVGEKNETDLNNAIAAAKPHIDKQNEDIDFYTEGSFSPFKLAYDVALSLKEKLEQSSDEVTLEEITLKTEKLIETTDNLIEAQGPVLKNDNENPNPARRKTVELNLQPVITNLANKEKTSGGVLGLDIGIVDLGLLSASQISKVAETNKHSIIVEKGTTYNADVTVAIHTVLGGQAFDVGIYKKDTTDGNYKQIKVLSGSSGGLLGIANTVKFTLDTLEEGEYVFILDIGGGLAVVQVAPFKLINQVVRNYEQSAEGVSVTGELLSDWNLGGKNQGIVSHIKSEAMEGQLQELADSEETIVQGRYGQLFINRDGNYKYLPANVPTNIGKVETFEYKVTNTHNGVSATAKLQIRISADTVEWNEGDWSQEVTVVKAKPKEQSTKIEASNTTNTVTSEDARTQWALWYDGTLQSGNFKVQDKSSVLKFDVSKNLSAKKAATVQVLNANNGKVVYSDTMDISSAAQNIVLRELDAGTYKINVKGIGSMGGSTGWIKNINVNSSTWGKYIVADPVPLIGNIRTIEGNKLGENSSLKTTISIRGYLIEGDNIATVQTYHKLDNETKVIAGKYGILTVKSDGAYSYKPNANIKVAGQADVFTYKLTHASGIESESTLTFKINPLITYTDQDDILVGTVNIDTFTGNKGSDTLVYNILKEDPTGGNNHDIWSDFHFGTIATDRNADRIDLRLLFEGQRINDITQYLQVIKNGQSIILKVDRDGAGSSYGFTELLTLNIPNGDVSLQKLIDNGQIIVQ